MNKQIFAENAIQKLKAHSDKKLGLVMCVVVLLFMTCRTSAIELTFFPGASLLDSKTIEGGYNLALGPMRNINSQWQPETEQLLEGSGTRDIYELPRNRSIKEALASYQQQLQLAGAAPLFICSGHNCGSSASWANQHFNDRRLYGLDQFQHLIAYRLKENGAEHVIVVYVVTRGNQRSYLLVDNFISLQDVARLPNVDTLRTLLEDDQRLLVPLQFTSGKWALNDEYAALLNRLLKLDPTLKLVLVVSDHRAQSLDKNIEQSKIIGGELQKSLSASSGDRVRVEGVGNLVPKRDSEVMVWLFKYH